MTVVLTAEPTVSGPALTLRPWTVEDAGCLVSAHRDPEMRRWLTTSLTSLADARRWVAEQDEGWVTGRRLSFAVLAHGSAEPDRAGRPDRPVGQTPDRPVGQMVVKREGGSPDSAEVGYWIAAEARGRGIASRALDLVSRWALGPDAPLAPDRLELIHTQGNLASCRVAEKCGYRFRAMLPAQPPSYPAQGHLHVRTRR